MNPGSKPQANKGNIYLVGFMGAGKTTVGRLLARKLDRPFFDLDALIEASAKLSIRDIFRTKGESHFRALESQILVEVAESEQAVVATGGGVVMSRGNRHVMQTTGFTVYLNWPCAVLIARIMNDSRRPLVVNMAKSTRASQLEELLGQRKPYYEMSACRIDCRPGMSAGDIVNRILAVVLA
ncbi:MAG: shikimate kinase [bacterium]